MALVETLAAILWLVQQVLEQSDAATGSLLSLLVLGKAAVLIRSQRGVAVSLLESAESLSPKVLEGLAEESLSPTVHHSLLVLMAWEQEEVQRFLQLIRERFLPQFLRS